MTAPHHIAEYVAHRLGYLRSKGININVHDDFSELEKLDLPGKSVSAMFDRRLFDLCPGKAFWMQGIDDDGETMHVQAMRMEDLGRASLSDVLVGQLSRAFGCHNNTPAAEASDITKKMTGKLVYHGDVWVSKKWRGHGLGETFAQIALGLAMIQWHPDYVYCFVEDPVNRTGFVLREGYMHFHPLNEEWTACFPWLYQEDWLAYMSYEDLQNLVVVDHRKKLSEQRQIPPHHQSRLKKPAENSVAA